MAWIEEYITELVVTLVVMGFIALAYEFWRIARREYGRVVDFFGARSKLRALDKEISRVRLQGRWVRDVDGRERVRRRRLFTTAPSIPILLIANNKGGVGKTTLAANLGAAWARLHRKRILWIDLDFQGTLSSTLEQYVPTSAGLAVDGNVKKIFLNRSPHQVDGVFINRQQLIGGLQGSAYYEANDAFADLEDWLMLRWVAQRSSDDIRLRLAHFLNSSKVQEAFDVVILDAPPRNTTGGINGFCASTHVLIPTRPDAFSCAGARLFLETTSEHHDLLAPRSKMVGFVRTLEPSWPSETPKALGEFLDELDGKPVVSKAAGAARTIPQYWPTGSRFDIVGAFPHRSRIANDAAQNITMLVDTERLREFTPLANEVAARIGLIDERERGQT